MMKRLTADVAAATGAKQLPAYYITLDDDSLSLAQP